MNLRLLHSFCTIITFFVSCTCTEDSSSKQEISPVLKDLAPSETCPNVMCTKAPSDITCNKTEVTNPNILSRLGTLKGCCPAFRCFEKDGSISTYFGITGEEISNDIRSSNDASVPHDKCSLVICPKPNEKDGNCVVSNAPDVNDHKPRGELQNCCPLYNCTVSDGAYHTRFALSAGNIPKDVSAVDKEKGTPGKDNKCPRIKCATRPVSYGCEATFQNYSSTLQTLGSLQECCPLWKCCFDDGTYFTHFEITSMSFWMAETSYFSSKKESTQSVAAPPSEKKDKISDQLESMTPKGRSFVIQPAPGLHKSMSVQSLVKQTTTAPVKENSNEEEEEEQESFSFSGGTSNTKSVSSSKSTKSGGSSKSTKSGHSSKSTNSGRSSKSTKSESKKKNVKTEIEEYKEEETEEKTEEETEVEVEEEEEEVVKKTTIIHQEQQQIGGKLGQQQQQIIGKISQKQQQLLGKLGQQQQQQMKVGKDGQQQQQQIMIINRAIHSHEVSPPPPPPPPPPTQKLLSLNLAGMDLVK